MALIDDENKARRLARAIASDVSLYNEEKIINGIRNDNLFDVMAADFEEGRTLYESRIDPSLLGHNLYDRAIVDIVIRSKAHIESPLW